MNINNEIIEVYKQLCETPSDINEHLSTLEKYAKNCEHITEMGVRCVVSSFPLAIANPKTLIGIDLYNPQIACPAGKSRFELINKYCDLDNIKYKFIQKNTLEIEIEDTDLLFIDTFHVYKQLKKELELHGNKAKKYIIFHDTTTYGFNDEIAGYEQDNILNEKIFIGLENKSGLLPAIKEFLDQNTHWSIENVFTNCNGLLILKRN